MDDLSNKEVLAILLLIWACVATYKSLKSPVWMAPVTLWLSFAIAFFRSII